ncbi:MAG: hypothetical protein C4322_16480 [Mastigocladus sp. ERB_26_1]
MEVCTKGTKDYCIDFLCHSCQPILDFGFLDFRFWIGSTDQSRSILCKFPIDIVVMMLVSVVSVELLKASFVSQQQKYVNFSPHFR